MHVVRERPLNFTSKDFDRREAGKASVWGLVAATAAVAAVTVVFVTLTASADVPAAAGVAAAGWPPLNAGAAPLAPGSNPRGVSTFRDWPWLFGSGA
jgi:hypothetical protein